MRDFLRFAAYTFVRLMADTGTGASWGTSSTTFNGTLTAIQIGEETIPVLDQSPLSATSYLEKYFGDVKEPPQVTLFFLFASGTAMPDLDTTETGTVTWPLDSGQTTAATLAGTGRYVQRSWPDLGINQLQESTIAFQFDGVTGPTFTAAT